MLVQDWALGGTTDRGLVRRKIKNIVAILMEWGKTINDSWAGLYQWCCCKIVLCFTYRSMENSSKKMCCHLQQMVLRVGLILTSIHLLYRCSSWADMSTFQTRKNRRSGHVLKEIFIKNWIQGRKLYMCFPNTPGFSLHVGNPRPFFSILQAFPTPFKYY